MLSPDVTHRTRDTAIMLRSGLNLIQQALSIYSVDMKLIVGNRQFKAMFDLPANLTDPGASFSDTIRYLAETGEYGDVDDVEAFVAARVQQAQAFEPHYMERRRANGRWISVEGGPLRQGGWITVYTDITQVRQQEEMLRSRSDELSGKLLDRSEELARTNRALEATITRLHETQQQLEAAEARIRMAAETTPAHIARLDLQERYTYSNQRLPLPPSNGADNIVGHLAADILGMEVYNIVSPAMHSAMRGDPKVVEFANPSDGRQIRVAFTPDTNAAGIVTGAYVLSMDVSLSQTGRAPLHNQHVATFPGWTARFDTMLLEPDGDGPAVALTLAESALLKAFLQNANRVLSREELFSTQGIRAGSDRALDIRVSRLRQKLKDNPKTPNLLRTIYGAGYIFTAEVVWQDAAQDRLG